MAKTPAKRACLECGTLLPEEAEYCPVCALRQAVETQSEFRKLRLCNPWVSLHGGQAYGPQPERLEFLIN